MKRLITFEGIEGCGKTTQIRMAAEYLKERRIPCIMTVEPGGTSLGGKIRGLLLQQNGGDICAEAEILLFAADRAQHAREIILPAFEKGLVVLCDRFTDATLAYQGFGRGLDLAFIKSINHFATAALKPDLTILFDLPVEDGFRRVAARRTPKGESGGKDRIEGETIAFHQKIREGYLLLAHEDPERFRIIDAGGTIPLIHQAVCSHLDHLLSGE